MCFCLYLTTATLQYCLRLFADETETQFTYIIAKL